MNALITAVFMSTLVMGGAALAAEPEAKEPAFGTREEYRACLRFEERLKEQQKSLAERVAASNNTLALLQAEAVALAETYKSTDPSDPIQVNDFNNQAEEHNRKLGTSNEQAERVKAEYAAYHELTGEFNKKCPTLVLRLVDRDVVQNETSRDLAKTSGD